MCPNPEASHENRFLAHRDPRENLALLGVATQRSGQEPAAATSLASPLSPPRSSRNQEAPCCQMSLLPGSLPGPRAVSLCT